MKINKTFFKSEFTERHLAFTNKMRIAVNDNCMELRAKVTHKKVHEIKANKNDPQSQDVKITKKTPIICKINDKEFELVNNEQFIIKKIENYFIYIQNEERQTIIPINKFQKLFYVAYCITIHRSQGATFNYPYTIHQFERLNKRLRYVALTRSSDIKFINII